MHYTIDYKGLDRQTKRAKALKDCQDYLGSERYNLAIKNLGGYIKGNQYQLSAFKSAETALGMFVGIQGYPARIFVIHAAKQARG